MIYYLLLGSLFHAKKCAILVFSRLSSHNNYYIFWYVGIFVNEEAEDVTSVFSLINIHIYHQDKVLVILIIE